MCDVQRRNEGDALWPEADHRISNHLAMILSILRMQRAEIKQADGLAVSVALSMFDDCCQRIESVARTHRALSRTVGPESEIDISTYLGFIAEGILNSTTSRQSYLIRSTSCDNCSVNTQQAASLGLLVSEIITNAIKYSHPAGDAGNIEIKCNRSERYIDICVVDDGPGLPPDFNPANDGHVGFKLMRSLASKIGGAISFDSSPAGLTVAVRLPRPNAQR